MVEIERERHMPPVREVSLRNAASAPPSAASARRNGRGACEPPFQPEYLHGGSPFCSPFHEQVGRPAPLRQSPFCRAGPRLIGRSGQSSMCLDSITVFGCSAGFRLNAAVL